MFASGEGREARRQTGAWGTVLCGGPPWPARLIESRLSSAPFSPTELSGQRLCPLHGSYPSALPYLTPTFYPGNSLIKTF